MTLFNSKALSRHYERAAPQFGRHDFLWRHTAHELRERLRDIRRDFPLVIESGIAPMVADDALRADKNMQTVTMHNPFDATHEIWPYAAQSCDAVITHNHLHWIDDVPGMLVQMRQSLKPDGVFIGSFFGGDTLHELRTSIAAVEMEIYGGMSPRVSPFASLQDVAALMQRTGFALPVVDHAFSTVTYADITALIADLRGMGQTSAIVKRDRRIVARDFWARVDAYYRTHFARDERLQVTVEIFYVLGWAPDASQPVPLKRGSATHALGDVLKIYEGK